MVQVWINEKEVSENSVALIEKLEKLTAAKCGVEKLTKSKAGVNFRSFVMFIADESIKPALSKLAKSKGISNCALTYLGDAKATKRSLSRYKIDASKNFKNIVFVYRDKKVGKKFMDLDAKNWAEVEAAVADLLN